jgi:membrane protein implicated in regulation of membrane protease activity
VTPLFFDPWMWLAAAAVLAIIETAIPGYVLLGFGIGAGLVGLALFPFEETAAALPQPRATLLAVWAAVSIAVWLTLRALYGRPARRPGGGRDINDFDNNP